MSDAAVWRVSWSLIRRNRGRLTRTQARRFREGGPTDEALEWVAKIYRVALLRGEGPTRAVEDAFELKRSTAAYWERGFLREAEGPGKAGGERSKGAVLARRTFFGSRNVQCRG